MKSIEVCKLLEKVGVDSIQITRPLSPLYFTKKLSEEEELLNYASKLIDTVKVPVIVGEDL